MSIKQELEVINFHMAKWAKMEWNKTTKMVINSLMTKRKKIIVGIK
jgi:hypothetical protein